MPKNPSAGAFAGIVARGRQQTYDVLTSAIEQSLLSQARIAELAGISREHLSRMLQRPRNVELDTLARIVFAACGATLRMELKPTSENARIPGGRRDLSSFLVSPKFARVDHQATSAWRGMATGSGCGPGAIVAEDSTADLHGTEFHLIASGPSNG